MTKHESGINFRNLIRDLADMYPQDVAEVVIIELVANALDAGADRIEVSFDSDECILVVKDNGKGMTSSGFEQYHDFAAGLKAKGTGIGFAGVGAKISFNIAKRVLTETKSKTFSGGSNWYLETKKKLVWEEIKPKHIRAHGTRVEIRFDKGAKIPFSSGSDLVKLIHRHYLPLLDKKFLELLEKLNCYPKKLRFIINGKTIIPFNIEQEYKLQKVRIFFPKKRDKRIGFGIFGLASTEYPLGNDVSGVLLSTWGKVVKPELFNQFPAGLGPRIFGLVDIPEFVKYLTTSKTDFLRRGKHKQLENLYSPIREEFKSWLAELGVQQTAEDDSDEALKLESEIKRILDEVPELNEFFGFRSPQKILSSNNIGEINAESQEGLQNTFPEGIGNKGGSDGANDLGEENGSSLQQQDDGRIKASPISRTAKRGPKITFSNSPERIELAWVEGNVVVINSGHPCYIRVKTNSVGKKLHNFYAIATTVQRFIGSSGDQEDSMFIDKMMAAWGNKK